MVAGAARAILFQSRYLSYGDACTIARRIFARSAWEIVYIHLDETTSTSTAALARLILLRRELLERGRDLRIIGLRGKARALYEISRLNNVLPLLPTAETAPPQRP